MSIDQLKAAFLARVSTVRVRVPLDHEKVEALNEAKLHRAELGSSFRAAHAAWEAGKRKIADTEPVEPDYTDADQWIADAEKAVDESSLMVVLQWQPGKYDDIMTKARADGQGPLWIAQEVTGAYYARTELFDGEQWHDALLDWDTVQERLSEGEILAVGTEGMNLANASDAGPFVKRSTNSKPD